MYISLYIHMISGNAQVKWPVAVMCSLKMLKESSGSI